MFEINTLKGNTHYFSAYSNVGIFETGDGKAVLIDSCDHKRMVRTLDRLLEEKGLQVSAVINTHAHVDHIAGNRFFSEKYGCRLLCTAQEQMYIKYTHMEPDIFYNAVSVNKALCPHYLVDGTEAEIITAANLPVGTEVIPLPGHSYEMIAVKTADDVIFLADSLMSVNTWKTHQLPFFGSVNRSLASMEKIKTLEAELFVPAHDEPTREIIPLVEYNIKKLNERKAAVFELCKGKTDDDVFVLLLEKLGLEMNPHRYQMSFLMVRNYLQALIEDKAIYGEYDGGRYYYHQK